MLPRNHPERIRVAFDDHRLVASALAGGDCIDGNSSDLVR